LVSSRLWHVENVTVTNKRNKKKAQMKGKPYAI